MNFDLKPLITALIIVSAIAGWASIELILWALSYVHISIS